MRARKDLDVASRGISEDLVVEILKRLPVKSLLRFKATSKRWYALISCPNFIKSHLAFAPDRVIILEHTRFFLFPDDDDESSAINLNTHGVESVNLNTDGVQPVIDFNRLLLNSAGFASCDGIVCLFGDFKYDASPPIIPITLWNPATKKFKSLPTSSYSASIDKIGARWTVGFGFDSKTDDYKVVAIISLWEEVMSLPRKPFMNYVEVYSLKTNSWRVIDAANAPIFLESPSRSTYTQGMHYWMMVSNIVSFDMEEEVFRVTPAPPSIESFIGLASSNESVVVIYCNTYSLIEVWVSKDLFTLAGDCWTLQYILKPTAEPGVPPRYDELRLNPLCLWKNCLLFTQGEACIPGPGYIIMKYVRKLCLYNPGTGKIRNLQFPEGIFCLSTCSYKETLVSLA